LSIYFTGFYFKIQRNFGLLFQQIAGVIFLSLKKFDRSPNVERAEIMEDFFEILKSILVTN
jgi:hypothetical protein